MVTKFFVLSKVRILIKFSVFKGFDKILKIAIKFILTISEVGKQNTQKPIIDITHNNTKSLNVIEKLFIK